MTVERVKCSECDAMILPRTAAKFDGKCAGCGSIPEYLLQERRQYRAALDDGSVFLPSAADLESSQSPSDLESDETVWGLEPEYYAESNIETVDAAVIEAQQENEGYVFLLSSTGSRLNFAFGEQYAVCEYVSQEGPMLYAHTEQNLNEQVPEAQHVEQACSCCGVGMHWYPSRFHMAREPAFALLRAWIRMDEGSVDEDPSVSGVQWLDMGDITYTMQGRG